MTDWYVRPAGGSYGNEDGTSYEDAWDGFSNIVWGTGGVEAGDTLWVCGTHNETLTVKASGTSGSYITIRGDCPSDSGIIDVTSELEDSSGNAWNSGVTWTEETGVGTNIWSASNMCFASLSSPARLYLDGTEYAKASDASSVDATDRWYYDSGSDTLYVYATQNPSLEYSSMIGSSTKRALAVDAKNYVDISNLNFKGGYYHAVNIAGCTNINLHDCTIGDKTILGVMVQISGTTYSEYINHCCQKLQGV